MKQKYFRILDNIKRQHAEDLTVISKPNDRVLIVDGLNAFIRGFSVNPTSNDDGIHIGGIVAFLKSIGYAIRLLKPTRCIIIFDGKGGSQRRRKLYPKYKDNRRPTQRFNRGMVSRTVDEEHKSMLIQLKRILDYLNCLPVSYMTVDNIEADDVIAYLSKKIFYPLARKIFIMSTDKDFLQLLDDKINIWSPTKKKLYDKPEYIQEEFEVPLDNYLLYRTIVGDSSDNIKGINGVKIKTLIKCFPILFNQGKSISIDELINYATQKATEPKAHKAYSIIKESKNILELNYELMRLDEQNISNNAKLKIQSIIKELPSRLNKNGFIRLFMLDKLYAGINDANFWLSNTFNVLDANVSLLEQEENLEK